MTFDSTATQIKLDGTCMAWIVSSSNFVRIRPVVLKLYIKKCPKWLFWPWPLTRPQPEFNLIALMTWVVSSLNFVRIGPVVLKLYTQKIKNNHLTMTFDLTSTKIKLDRTCTTWVVSLSNFVRIGPVVLKLYILKCTKWPFLPWPLTWPQPKFNLIALNMWIIRSPNSVSPKWIL